MDLRRSFGARMNLPDIREHLQTSQHNLGLFLGI
jgi:hypothetical protein